MSKKIFISCLCFTALLLASCSAPTNLYSWYNYEDVTYKYSKLKTDELKNKVYQQYDKMEKKQVGLRKVVPPGFYAEYGFMLCKDGKTEEGLTYLKQEIALYPESEVFIGGMIKNLEK